MRGRRSPQKVLDAIHGNGPIALWFKLLEATVYRRLRIYDRLLADPPDRRSSVPLRTELLTAGQIPAYLALRPSIAEREVRRRLDARELCFALRSGEPRVH